MAVHYIILCGCTLHHTVWLYITSYCYCRASGVPTSDVAVEDMILCNMAKRLGMPYSTGIVEYAKVKKDLR